jgi:predicted aspartyl protease
MVKGKIENGLHPKVAVEVAGKIASGKFTALVDTGFDLEFALYRDDAAKLGLKPNDFVWIDYADGARVREPSCTTRVLWHGKWKEIQVVLSNDKEPAIGTGLLQGSIATLDFVRNKLTIEEPLAAKRKKK